MLIVLKIISMLKTVYIKRQTVKTQKVGLTTVVKSVVIAILEMFCLHISVINCVYYCHLDHLHCTFVLIELISGLQSSDC